MKKPKQNKTKHQTKSAGQTAAFHNNICIIILINIIISLFGSGLYSV